MSESLNRKLEGRADQALKLEESLRARATAVVLGCFLLAMAVTLGAWLVLGQSVIRRLADLRQHATAVGAGTFDARVAVHGSDELTDLAATFNEMSASLLEQRRRLLQSERLAILGQLSAGVAHEINNPLGVILGYAKLLRRGGTDASESRKQLGIIEDEVRQCQRIVQGLLDLARPVSSERSVLDLSELARDAVGRLVETGKNEGRSIDVSPPRLRVTVRGDATALRQVVSNLVMNAVEASPPTGSVSVEVREAADHAEVEVRDDGPGIPDEVLPKIFDPFFTTKPRGSGLGLAISQAIASAHDGNLELLRATDGGTRAILRLPVSRSHDAMGGA